MRLSPLEVFIAYAPCAEDEALHAELAAHLAPLERAGKINLSGAGALLPGDDKRAALSARLARADIVLLLVSAKLLASRAGDEHAIEPALARHHRGDVRLIPVLLRACAGAVRAAYRDATHPEYHGAYLGFRVAAG